MRPDVATARATLTVGDWLDTRLDDVIAVRVTAGRLRPRTAAGHESAVRTQSAILFTLLTGRRLSAVVALDWADVHLRERTYRVVRTTHRIPASAARVATPGVHDGPPKTSVSSRLLPLSDAAADGGINSAFPAARREQRAVGWGFVVRLVASRQRQASYALAGDDSVALPVVRGADVAGRQRWA